MSASFPFFSPAVSLPVKPRRRLVDAGYYDNYGVSLTSSWLMSGKNRNWIAANATKILLIQIRDGVDQPQRRFDTLDPDSSTGLSRSTEEVSSPLEGLYNARVGSSSFRNDGQLELLTHFWTLQEENRFTWEVPRKSPQDRPFQVATFEFPYKVALSWYLTKRERDQVRTSLGPPAGPMDIDYPKRFDRMVEWWKSELSNFKTASAVSKSGDE
jgi:hypothetical protein